MSIKIYRGDAVIAQIESGRNVKFTHGLMGAHKIAVSGISNNIPLPVQYDDYMLFRGVQFKINTVPELKVDARYTYDLTFEGPKYTWHDKLFMHEGDADFSYYGNALLFLKLFITNINEIDPGWIIGKVDDTEEKHITFSNVTCHEAIILIADAFKLEFEDVAKNINLVAKVGRNTSLSFEFGRGKGLYEFSRNYVSDKNVVTKVYGFGGTRNLPPNYRGAKKRLTFDPGFYTNNTDLYKVKEGQYTNDEIFPQRVASVEQASIVTQDSKIFTVKDSTLDFNVKDTVIKGLEPKISFTTGQLAGEEFVITDYNPTTKVISYKGFLNNNNVQLPSVTFNAKAGDKYTLLDIDMSKTTYVAEAESKVNTETLKYTLENSVPKVEYGGTLDPMHIRDNQIFLNPGDLVNFKDTKLGLNASIRITEISYPLDFALNGIINKDTKIEITIANFVTYSAQQRQRDEKLIQRHEIKTIDLNSIEAARRNSSNLIDLRESVIDPQGNYFTEKIKPGSIETLYLSIGAKATNFNLSGVAFDPNHSGDPNAFTATAGQLIHYDLKIEGSGFIWQMQPYSISGLVAANKYFLYAKISKTSLVGSWELSTEVKTAESLAGYYILQAGVLFPVVDGRRDNAITSGMVFIIGDQITAGKIQSINKQMYIDLTLGQLKLGDDQFGMEWNVTTPNRLIIRGAVTQNAGGITAPLTVFRGPYSPTVKYYEGDSVSYNGSTWVYKNPNPSTGNIPAENTYWTIGSKKGDDGANGNPGAPGKDGVNGLPGQPGVDGKFTEYRFAKNGSTTTAPNLVASDVNPVGWGIAQPTLLPAEYAWVSSAQKTAAGALVTNWTTPIRFNGADGAKGDPGLPGASGPFMNFRGDFDPEKMYTGTSTRIEAVKYNGAYYTSRVDAGNIPKGTLPTSTVYWNPYGGQFETLATGLLLAELAFIKNLGVENLKTSDPNRYLQILGELNRLSFFSMNTNVNPNVGYEALRIADNIDSQAVSVGGVPQALAGIRAMSPSGRASYLSPNGVFSNGSGTQFLAGSSGISTNASLVGLLFNRNPDSNGLSSAIYGSDQTSSADGNSTSYAGYFNGNLFASTFNVAVRANVSGQLDSNSFHVTTSDCTLPQNPRDGQLCIVQNNNGGTTMAVNGPIMQGNFNTSSLGVQANRSAIFIYSKAFGRWANLIL